MSELDSRTDHQPTYGYCYDTSEGNPGRGGVGGVFILPTNKRITFQFRLGHCTNNFTETKAAAILTFIA